MNRAESVAKRDDRATGSERLGTADTRACGSGGQRSLDRLISQWRDEAETFRRRGVAAHATLLESCADELESALEQKHDELLNLTEAARVSGYSREHLGRLLKDGKIPNAGQPSAPKIRRGNLPTKSAKLRLPKSALQCSSISKDDVVRSVVTQGKGAR